MGRTQIRLTNIFVGRQTPILDIYSRAVVGSEPASEYFEIHLLDYSLQQPIKFCNPHTLSNSEELRYNEQL